MKRWQTAAVALGGVAAAAVAASAWGAHRWAGGVRDVRARLDMGRIGGDGGGEGGEVNKGGEDGERGDGAPAPAPPRRYDARELDGLPAPVQRYFRAVLVDGQPVVDGATVDLAGTFNLSAGGEQWKPFTSRQHVVARWPGFVWDARIALVPGVAVRVVDSYVAGRGFLRAAVQGLYTLAEIEGGGGIARGEFMRWFAEAAWYPTALLPGQGVRWEAVDDRSARATAVDGAVGATLLFRFDDAGLIASFRAESRDGTVDGRTVSAPWEGAWSDYRRCGGMLLPMRGEVAWMRPEGRRPYFVGTVTGLRLAFAP